VEGRRRQYVQSARGGGVGSCEVARVLSWWWYGRDIGARRGTSRASGSSACARAAGGLYSWPALYLHDEGTTAALTSQCGTDLGRRARQGKGSRSVRRGARTAGPMQRTARRVTRGGGLRGGLDASIALGRCGASVSARPGRRGWHGSPRRAHGATSASPQLCYYTLL
jgi:hypothetical protein